MGGLLDWEDANPSYPNFDAFTFDAKPIPTPAKAHASTPNAAVYKRAESTESSSTSGTSHSSSSALLKPNKKRSHRAHYVKRRVSGQPSFDLFGADDELQEAEPQMKWCDTCLKQCTVH